MTQGMRNFFNLPLMEDVLKEESFDEDEIQNEKLLQTVAMAQESQARLDMIEGKDHTIAMDNLHKETLKHAQDLMDLGFNVDIPRARGIFEVATMMYGRAIEAKNSKREAQLKMMKLALDQRRLDLDEKRVKSQLGETEANTITGDAVIVREDRNELIKRMREQRDHKNS